MNEPRVLPQSGQPRWTRKLEVSLPPSHEPEQGTRGFARPADALRSETRIPGSQSAAKGSSREAGWLIFCAACLLAASALSAAEDPSVPHASADSATVRDLGRREALSFEGNSTFPSNCLSAGLSQHLDFHLACHPAAPLAEYTGFLRRRLLLGYRHEGFPEATVDARVDAGARKIRVQIQEGPRCYCGDIRLTGVPSMTNEVIRRKLVETLSGLGGGSTTNLGPAIWSATEPAPFDEITATNLTGQISDALAELDYLFPTVKAKVIPDTARRKAHLEIEIADEGMKGVIDDIEITGNRTNSTQQILDFLKFKPGMEIHARLLNDITNRLWNCARFLKHQAALTPLPEPGKFRLDIVLREYADAPPLSREFSPVEEALLKFREWLLAWEERGEDIVISGSALGPKGGGSLEYVLSPTSGFALCLRSASADTPPRLAYGAVVSRKVLGFYSVWRQGKFVSTGTTNSGITVFFQLMPTPDDPHGSQFDLALGAGFTTQPNPARPIEVTVNVAPVAMIHLAHYKNVAHTVESGVLTCRDEQPDNEMPAVLQIEVATGRLIRAVAEASRKEPQGLLEVRFQEGAFSRTVQDLSRATATHTNAYHADRPVGAFLVHTLTDILESTILESPLVQPAWGNDFDPAKVQAALREARTFLDQTTLTEFLAPVQDLLATLLPKTAGAEESAETFFIPWDPALLRLNQQNMIALLAPFALSATDFLWARDAWPWTLTREVIFNLVGAGRYTGVEVQKLFQSDQVGPLADLAAAHLVGRASSSVARRFARKGQATLTATEFQKDYRTLLQTDAPASRMIVNGLELLRGLSDDRLTALASAAALRSEDAALLRDAARAIRATGGKSTAEALWPVIERHWASSLKPCVQAWLDRFAPKVDSLTDPQALYAHGVSLITGQGPLQDAEEAVRAFRKAAEMGHPGALRNLGLCYEEGRGVTRDLAVAASWYRKAADQNVPHAACRLGDLYRAGYGVDQNLEEAVRWYERDTERDCAHALFMIGQIREKQNQPAQALPWYRRAAELGAPEAQYVLADRLSDGITVDPPDYVEAYLWFSLAANQGHRAAQSDLRRVKRHLAPGQIDDAKRRADKVLERIREKQRAAAQAPDESQP